MLEHEWDKRSVDFPLKPGAVVLDIGGYKGRWSLEMAKRYPESRIFFFEPQEWAFKIAKGELSEFPGVQLYKYGLGVESGIFEMEEFETDGASFILGHSQRQQAGEGHLVAMEDWLIAAQAERGLDRIDLIMMNIEAYEFKLIPYMIEKGILQRVGYFMCQFHPRNYEQQDEFEDLRKKLAGFMDVHFDYGIMLMCWKARDWEPIPLEKVLDAVPESAVVQESPKRKATRKKKKD